MAVKKVNYNGSSKIIKALCKAVNDIIDSGGGGGDTVTITPTLLSGNKIADYTINGVADELYIPDDGKDMTETFTSSDVADGSATSWTSVTKLDSGETHSSIFAKMSQMFKNVRYLYKTLGNTDLSAIADGTVTGAVSTLNAATSPAFGKTVISFATVAGNTVSKTFTIPKGGVYLVNLNCFVQAGANDLFQFIVNDVNGRVWGGSASIHNYTAAALGDTTAFSIIVDTRGLSSNYNVTLVTWARYVYSAGANIKYIKIRS